MILLDSFRAELVAASCANLGPILGIDTAGPVAHLGLIAGGEILDFRALPARSHASSLPDAVIAMLADHSLNMRDISAIAVGTGPGSFTGVRIGLAYAKGIAIGADIALAGVGSLDSIAATALDSIDLSQSTSICAILDARKGEVYTALYRAVSDRLEKVSEDLIVSLEKLVSNIPVNAVIVGDHCAREAAARCAASAVVELETMSRRGAWIVALGAARIARGNLDRPAALEPRYVRPPEAVAKLAKLIGLAPVAEGLWNAERKNSSSSI